MKGEQITSCGCIQIANAFKLTYQELVLRFS